MPFRMGSVNCYLIAAGSGYVLIDTGNPNNRQELSAELEKAGCKPGLLRLIVLTHGDFDHTGNAAYLRSIFGGQIAMHGGDLAMAERGDMFANRKKTSIIIRKVFPLLTGYGKSERFSPDLLLNDGDELSRFGMDAQILSIPGHSKGSIAVLTSHGSLFCGDLLVNTNGPTLNSLMDDMPDARSSLQKLAGMEIGTVYPGHGSPFPIDQIRCWME